MLSARKKLILLLNIYSKNNIVSKSGQESTEKQKTDGNQSVFIWWSIGGSNSWPQDCEPCALPSELMPQNHFNTF